VCDGDLLNGRPHAISSSMGWWACSVR
jgi:hypothetical protein